jgi:hypothetical protein
MIVSAAIKYRYKDFPKQFIIFTGVRHPYIIDRVRSGIEDGLLPKLIEQAQGFVDDKDVFYTREEAYEHAKMCGQICEMRIYEREKDTIFRKKMISEDLW